jgi:uncharacterized protein
MALLRILVDGYSLLHSWPELAPGKPRYSSTAREELIQKLLQYRDASGISLTIVFDGVGQQGPKSKVKSRPEFEIIFSKNGQNADQVIERAAQQLASFGEVLVVTDDHMERETVMASGCVASSCLNFIQTVESTLAEMQRDIKHLNRRERNKFTRRQ